MNDDLENEGFRRYGGDGPYQRRKPGLKSVIFPVVFLILWTGIIISALLNIMNKGADPFALVLVICIGGFGLIGVGRSLIKRIRRM